MSKLFVYYSLSGNGDAVARRMEELGYETRKVVSSLRLSEKLIPRLLEGGYSAMKNETPDLVGYDSDVGGFDEVCIGSPVWNSRLASPVNTVLRDTGLAGKKLTFVLYSGGGTGKKADAKIKKLFPDAGIIHLKEPKTNEGELEKLAGL